MLNQFGHIIVSLLFAFSFVAKEASAEEISIIVVGDITIGSELVPIIDRDDGVELFAGITELIKSADIATAPLNMPISDLGEPKYGAEHTYRAPPVIARRLANVGFNVVSLATPHIMDFGVEALADTIDLLDWYHVRTVGATPPPPVPDEDSEATDSTVEPPELPPNLPKAGPASIRVKSAQVAFLAYYRANQFAANPADPIAHAVYSEMIDDVKAAKQQSELVVVCIHWGKARQTQAVGSRQRYFARGLIDAGADLVLCQRLHTLQGAEIYNGKPIIYSLADFIYEAYDKQYSKVVVPKITFLDGAFQSIELTPIWVDNPDAKYQPQVLNGEGAKEALTHYQKLCADLKTPMTIEGERGWIRPEAR